MFFRQIEDDKLAQYTYIVGCQKTGEALVIDPERDIDRFIEIAEANDLKITAGEEVLVLLNGVGSTTLMELYLVLRRVKEVLDGRGVTLARTLVGEFLTVQEMGGFQMCVARMDPELIELWDAPCNTPSLVVQ